MEVREYSEIDIPIDFSSNMNCITKNRPASWLSGQSSWLL